MAMERRAGAPPIRGALQAQIMAAVWHRGSARVEDVREALPKDESPAYTTVQTVMNRLVEHGLLRREREGRAFRYHPAVAEADYISDQMAETLSGASPEARRAALMQLVGDLDQEERAELRKLAATIDRRRR